MLRRHVFPVFCLLLVLCASCSSTKPLAEGEYMLVKNKVTVTDARNPNFEELKSYVRPIPNKKFLDIIRFRTMWYSLGQPTFDKNGQLKDSKFRRFLRYRVGEAPVLLDSNYIESSLKQLTTVMNQWGYFDAEADYSVQFKRHNPKKAVVNYSIMAHAPYHIRKINYDIAIPEYRRIFVIHKEESDLEEGMQYDEDAITEEFTRIVNLLRDEGYYYVEKSIMRGEVTYDMPADSTQADPHTVTLSIILRIPEGENSARYLYKYHFNNVYVHTRYNANDPLDQMNDTVVYRNYRDKTDSTFYRFITPHYDDLREPIRDFKYRTIAQTIYTRTGEPYSQEAKRRSSMAISQLDNFSYYNITYQEVDSLLDTLHHVGYLDAIYRLTRSKVHSVGGQIDLRNDKSYISLSYSNRNIFKGAEQLKINLSGGYFYYSLSNLFHNHSFSYPEFGLNVSLTWPKLLFFGNYHKRSSVRRNTAIKFGVNYSGLYHRLLYNAAITYNWSPISYMNHSFSPIDISTINNNDRWYANMLNYWDYPESYQNRFNKFFMLSLKYNFDFLVPFAFEHRAHNLRMSVSMESSGLFLKGINSLFTPDHRWVLGVNSLDEDGYNYTSFEKMEFTWNYSYKFDSKNTMALRMNAGAIIPLDKDSYVPYERGFYMGTSNSMRGWPYRGVGPGSYEHGRDSLFTGDVKIELNLEYRGTLYRSFKYGIFADAGNIWLTHDYGDMEGANFDIRRFYKEFALDAGVGLRLDFGFFVIRVDYAVPLYDPTRTSIGRWINKKWFNNDGRRLALQNGLKFAIGYAF